MVVIVMHFVRADQNDLFVPNIVSLLGILLLAAPAIRVNEQGRLIESVRKLQSGITAARAKLEAQSTLDDEQRKVLRKDLNKRDERLEAILNELTTGRGAWTPWVHYTLYSGYVLMLSAATVRVVP